VMSWEAGPSTKYIAFSGAAALSAKDPGSSRDASAAALGAASTRDSTAGVVTLRNLLSPVTLVEIRFLGRELTETVTSLSAVLNMVGPPGMR
jgi:hypothetical protein